MELIKEDAIIDLIVSRQKAEEQAERSKKLIIKLNKTMKSLLKKQGTESFDPEELQDCQARIEEHRSLISDSEERISSFSEEVEPLIQFVIKFIKNRPEAVTVTVGNYKGGAGKTSISINLAYILAEHGLDVLVIDMDAQTNATKALMVTKSVHNPDEVISIKKTIMKGVQDGSFEDLPVSIVDHLDLLPTSIEFEDFAKYLYQTTDSDYEADHFFSKLLKPLKNRYDLIIIDIPPLNIECTKNAVLSSDYVLISLQTQARSLDGAEEFVKRLQKVSMKYSHNIEIVGALPVMLKKQRSSDQFILDQAKESFGEGNLFRQVIPNLDRVPSQDLKGIVMQDRHDVKLNAVFTDIAYEFLERLYYFENTDQGVEV